MTLIVRNSSLESGVVQILTILTSTITGVQIVKRGTHRWGKLGETAARARVPSPFPSLVFSCLLFFFRHQNLRCLILWCSRYRFKCLIVLLKQNDFRRKKKRIHSWGVLKLRVFYLFYQKLLISLRELITNLQ